MVVFLAFGVLFLAQGEEKAFGDEEAEAFFLGLLLLCLITCTRARITQFIYFLFYEPLSRVESSWRAKAIMLTLFGAKPDLEVESMGDIDNKGELYDSDHPPSEFARKPKGVMASIKSNFDHVESHIK